jgi:nitrate reductase gamma subunit
MTGLPLLIISYLLIFIFLAIFIYKARKMAKLPMHLRWELSPVPHEKGKSQYGGSYLEEYDWWTKKRKKSLVDEAIYMGKEIFLLKGVFENNKKLWYLSFPFHFGMYVLTGAAVLTFIFAFLPTSFLPLDDSITSVFIETLAAIGFIIGGIGTLGLMARRFLDPNLKNYTTGGALFNLFFLLALFFSGLVSTLISPNFYGEMNQYAQSLIFADSTGIVSGVVSLHCIITLLFLAYLPFTKMLHFLAKYFTYHEVRWNDSPMAGNEKMQKEVIELLNQRVSWAAPHLNADGKKNWVDIATEEKKH